MTSREPHIVVVGGGPVGLSAALLLHRAGIRCTVLERDLVPSSHPKARGIRTRTMELFAQWGLAEELRSAALPPEANRFIYCDTLAGEEIARSPEPDDQHEGVSPVGPCRVSQDTAHRVLLAAVRRCEGIDVRAGVAATGVAATQNTVVVGTDANASIEADYVVAADGVSSTLRRGLGIPLEGDAVLGWGQSIYWHGDLRRWTEDRLCIQYVTGHRLGRPASIATVDGRDRWVTMLMRPGSPDRPTPPTVQEAAAAIVAAVGVDIDPEIVDIATWRITAQVAQRWRKGRVFLAGDAAHSFPPTGGFGMNTGVQDVDNLVWKLALVLRDEASEVLLDTYELERIGIARSNAAWSVANGERLRDIGRAIAGGDRGTLDRLLEDQRGHVDATDQDLGFGYTAGALAGTDPDPQAGSPLHVARLGHRFPSTSVLVAGREVSSITGLAGHPTLLAADVAGWVEAAEGTPVVVGVAPENALAGHPAVMVRPDGIVGWVATREDTPHRLPAVWAELAGRAP